MARKKLYPEQSNLFKNISRTKLITGLVTGVLYAFTLYAFLYVIRETFRVSTATDRFDMWILTDCEALFYNTIYAFIAVIMGQAECFRIWFNTPKRVFTISGVKRTSVINDQCDLNWSFMYWITNMGVMFVIGMGLALKGYYVFSLYPDYNYLFILIIIVLFMQTWKTLRITYRRNSLKWMFISAVIVSVLSLSVSRIDIIDYNQINEMFSSKNAVSAYKLKVPESNVSVKYIERETIEITLATDGHNKEPKVIINNNIVPFDKINSVIDSLKEEYSDYIFLLRYRIIADSNIEMTYIHKLEKVIVDNMPEVIGAAKIGYAVLPPNREFDDRYYSDYTFNHYVVSSKSMLQQRVLENYDREISRSSNIIRIEYSDKNMIINNNVVLFGDAKSVLADLMIADTDFFAEFHMNCEADFQSYITSLTSFYEAMSVVRNNYAQRHYSKSFSMLDDDLQNEVKRKIPAAMMILTPEKLEIINRAKKERVR
jgi:hypothetical protein